MNVNIVPTGYERFFWDDFTINPKPVQSKQCDHNGMLLWRQPTAVESQINLKDIADAFDESELQLRSDIDKLKDKLIGAAIAGIIELQPADYHTLIVNPDKKDLEAFIASLQKIYDKGRELVVQELEDQGAFDVDTEFDIEDDLTALDNLGSVTASRVANDVQSRVIGTAATLAALGLVGKALYDKLFSDISGLSTNYVDIAAATASHVALNLGRDATGANNSDLVKEIYYSSVLDRNTCIPCQDADGETSLNTEADLPPAPNPDCEGRGRCRCIHVYVFKTEQTKGGEGSGNFGHQGRPGMVGGSAGESSKPTYDDLIKEQEKNFARLNVHANLHGMDIELAKIVYQQVSEFKEEHPSAFKYLQSVRMSEMSPDCFAKTTGFTDTRYVDLQFNDEWWKDKDRLDEALFDLQADGYLADGSAIGIVNHELGHVLDRPGKVSVYGNRENTDDISSYATENAAEGFAEAYALYKAAGINALPEPIKTVFKAFIG